MPASPHESERERNLDAYNQCRAELEAKHHGQYVVVDDGRVVGTFSSFKEALADVELRPSTLVFEIGSEPIMGPIRALAGRKLGTLGH